ncbi:AAA family ATPase [Rubritalea spongiae]|uniref:AAA family ATPase n=1 Tax=Rubritalea spongiae TaxID=430797 RepID=A0ABW5DZ05_9BACT
MSKDKDNNDKKENKLEASNQYLQFSYEMIVKATRDLSDTEKKEIRWLFQLAKQSQWTLKQTAERISYSPTVLHKVFKGTYEAKLDSIIKAITQFRSLYEKRQSIERPDFIETSLTKRIFEACDFAIASQSVVFLWGENQIGKTEALEEYQRRNNHGQTIYVRIPAASGILMVVQEIAKAMGISPNSCYTKIRERILRALDDSNTLIIDELHLVFSTYQKGAAVKALEFIRELYDRSKCGLILCGTNVLRDEFMSGEHKKMLAQLLNRGTAHIQLEDKPLPADLEKFFEFYDLGLPTGKAASAVKDIVHYHGLGKFVKTLQAASRLAHKQEKALTWDHFLTTQNALTRLGRKKDK